MQKLTDNIYKANKLRVKVHDNDYTQTKTGDAIQTGQKDLDIERLGDAIIQE